MLPAGSLQSRRPAGAPQRHAGLHITKDLVFGVAVSILEVGVHREVGGVDDGLDVGDDIVESHTAVGKAMGKANAGASGGECFEPHALKVAGLEPVSHGLGMIKQPDW